MIDPALVATATETAHAALAQLSAQADQIHQFVLAQVAEVVRAAHDFASQSAAR